MMHRISHWFGWNTGEVEVFWRGQKLYVGFRCHGCGKLSGVHESCITRTEPEGANNG